MTRSSMYHLRPAAKPWLGVTTIVLIGLGFLLMAVAFIVPHELTFPTLVAGGVVACVALVIATIAVFDTRTTMSLQLDADGLVFTTRDDERCLKWVEVSSAEPDDQQLTLHLVDAEPLIIRSNGPSHGVWGDVCDDVLAHIDAAQSGVAQDGAAQDGHASDGAVEVGVIEPGVVESGVMESGVVQDGDVFGGAVETGQIETSKVETGVVANSAVTVPVDAELGVTGPAAPEIAGQEPVALTATDRRSPAAEIVQTVAAEPKPQEQKAAATDAIKPGTL